MTEDDALLARVVAALKEPVHMDPDLDRRVMEEIGAARETDLTSIAPRSRLAWLRRSRTIRLSPLGGLAAAAALATLLLAGVRVLRPDSPPTLPVAVQASATREVTQFVLVAPEAASVSVVGDFNDWSFSATPLARQAGDGVWWVTVPLRPGRYRYAFLVDGISWRQDPNAPSDQDEFGRPNSVVTIGGA